MTSTPAKSTELPYELWTGSSMEWRKIICSPFCPLPPGHKHVLTCLAHYGGKWGEDIFPSQRQLALRAGVTQRCVHTAVNRASQEGWIFRSMVGGSRGYKRTVYELTIPKTVLRLTGTLPRKFWEPPYSHQLVTENGHAILVPVMPT